MFNRFFRLGLMLTALLSVTSAPAAPLVELAARQSVDSWLKLTDKADYGEAWAACAPIFRVQIERQEFVKALDKVRTPLGAVESRELIRMFYSTTLPSAPEAHYVVIQYKTKFANRAEPAIEVITPILVDAEGSPVPVVEDPELTPGEWKISGYYIQ